MASRKQGKTKNRNPRNKNRKTLRRGNKIRRGGEGDLVEPSEVKETSARKIQTFMKTPKVSERRTSRFLKNICSDSNVCIAFGIEQPKIYKFFDGYTNKALMKLPIRSIGSTSSNGFVNEITYERDGYISHAILKSSLKRGADNLVYEYLVGKYMNKMSKYFPCIMQTYSLIKYGDADSYHILAFGDDITDHREFESIHISPLSVEEPTSEDTLLQACTRPLNFALLVQHIKNAPTFYDINKQGSHQEITCLLHQIYFTLHCLKNTFTHYDLHMKNVLCYSVGDKKYIEFVYHMNDGTVLSYNYHRLAYMIDYGRSFFYESDTHNSAVILDKLCKAPCPTPCGTGDGFRNLFGNPAVHITGSQRNISADLRLIKLTFDNTKKIYHKIKFDGAYSTSEVMDSGLPDNINNVSDVVGYISKYVAKSNEYMMNAYTRRGFTKLGTLHIYEDGTTPMNYIPEPVVNVRVVSTVAPPTSILKSPPTATATATATAMDAPARVSTKISSVVDTPYYNQYMSMYPRTKKRPTMPAEFYEQDTAVL